jgi:hopene-associated glycosyltransferase HpnB
MLILAAASLALWLAVLLLPWQPWRCAERLETDDAGDAQPSGFTVLIPARNEAAVLGETLAALRACAPSVPVVVVDDQSSDATADIARGSGLAGLRLVRGTPPPAGWTGKLWALEQGLQQVTTSRVLLLDADIRLAPGMPGALQEKADEGYALVSACAQPCWAGAAARWLQPAFVSLCQRLYPFRLANRNGSRIAAAAGGVVLVDRRALVDAGGFGAWRNAIIDDCTLAAHVKRAGHRCWIGLSRGATSLRRADAGTIAHMVARTAFVQLRESVALLVAATALLVLAFWIPVLAVATGDGMVRWLGAGAWLLLIACYVPTLLYYRRNPLASVLLPATATFFLAATWFSAWRALAGTRSVWKDRRYQRGPG